MSQGYGRQEGSIEYADVITGCDTAASSLETLSTAGEFRYQPLWNADVGLAFNRFRANGPCEVTAGGASGNDADPDAQPCPEVL